MWRTDWNEKTGLQRKAFKTINTQFNQSKKNGLPIYGICRGFHKNAMQQYMKPEYKIVLSWNLQLRIVSQKGLSSTAERIPWPPCSAGFPFLKR